MKIKTRNLWFYCGFGLTIIRNFLTNSNLFNISNKILLSIIILYGISMLYTKITIREIILCIYGLITYFISKDVTLLFFIFVIISSKGINKEEIIRFWLIIESSILGLCMIIYPILYQLHSPYAVANMIDGRFRYYFFHSHPNTFGVNLAFCIMAYIYVKYKKLSYFRISILLSITALFIYLYPNSRTASFILIIFMIFLFLMKKMPRIWKTGMKIILPFLFGFSLIFVLRILKGEEFSKNNFVSRFIGVTAMLKIYPINAFGHFIENLGELVNIDGNWITLWGDVAYIRLFITFGIVGGWIFLKKFSRTLYIYLKKKEFLRVSLLAIVCVYAVLEWSAFQIMTSFPLIFVAEALEPKQVTNQKVRGTRE